jgi:hypothetical protein
MKLFAKQQIKGALKARHLYKTLGYPSNANFEAVLQVGGIGDCTVSVDNAKVAYKIWGASVFWLKRQYCERDWSPQAAELSESP